MSKMLEVRDLFHLLFRTCHTTQEDVVQWDLQVELVSHGRHTFQEEDEVTVGPVHHPETCFARAVQIGTDAPR